MNKLLLFLSFTFVVSASAQTGKKFFVGEWKNYLRDRSFGFGNMKFNYSFDTGTSDKSETSIGIYYDFADEMKDHYFSQVKAGKEKGAIVKVNAKDVYLGINWQGKFEGKIFLENHIVIAYYTRDDKLQQLLRECITSFRYR